MFSLSTENNDLNAWQLVPSPKMQLMTWLLTFVDNSIGLYIGISFCP